MKPSSIYLHKLKNNDFVDRFEEELYYSGNVNGTDFYHTWKDDDSEEIDCYTRLDGRKPFNLYQKNDFNINDLKQTK